jgi:hypothetical protein
MSKPFYSGRLSINKEKSSPYWMVTFQGPDGKMRRRSTKVPVNGGEFEGDRITAKLAERLAYQRGVQIACAEAEEYQAHNNVSVRAWCDDYVRRKAALVSEDTARNARTAYKHFYAYLGGRADAPLRLITKADIKGFVAARREEVRQKTVAKDLAALSQAFTDAVDSEVIDRNPCTGVSIPPDRAGEKLHKEAFTLDEIRYMIEHFPPLWSSAVRYGMSYQAYFRKAQELYAKEGCSKEWKMHHQGGPTGYGCREFTVTPETKGVIKKNQAYAWNPTIAGTKCEDTTFLADNGVEIFTRTKAWPCTVIETEYGSCSVADILYIKNE